MTDAVRLTRSELRELDRLAVEEYGIPSAVLMENAGRGAAEFVLDVQREWAATNGSRAASTGDAHGEKSFRVAIFCGSGNNGGDGGVVARHLANAGITVDVFSTESIGALRGDAALQRRIIDHMGIPVHGVGSTEGLDRSQAAMAAADVLVDGLLGTGFQGDVRPKVARVIERINALRSQRRITVIALDLPSGLDCDRGLPAEPTIMADTTVTFVAPKVGFDHNAARPLLGRVVVVPIGAPIELIERVRQRSNPS